MTERTESRSGESRERELIRRLASYIDASSLSNTDHWRMSKLKREAVAYLDSKALRSETAAPTPPEGWFVATVLVRRGCGPSWRAMIRDSNILAAVDSADPAAADPKGKP